MSKNVFYIFELLNFWRIVIDHQMVDLKSFLRYLTLSTFGDFWRFVRTLKNLGILITTELNMLNMRMRSGRLPRKFWNQIIFIVGLIVNWMKSKESSYAQCSRFLLWKMDVHPFCKDFIHLIDCSTLQHSIGLYWISRVG